MKPGSMAAHRQTVTDAVGGVLGDIKTSPDAPFHRLSTIKPVAQKPDVPRFMSYGDIRALEDKIHSLTSGTTASEYTNAVADNDIDFALTLDLDSLYPQGYVWRMRLGADADFNHFGLDKDVLLRVGFFADKEGTMPLLTTELRSISDGLFSWDFVIMRSGGNYYLTGAGAWSGYTPRPVLMEVNQSTAIPRNAPVEMYLGLQVRRLQDGSSQPVALRTNFFEIKKVGSIRDTPMYPLFLDELNWDDEKLPV